MALPSPTLDLPSLTASLGGRLPLPLLVNAPVLREGLFMRDAQKQRRQRLPRNARQEASKGFAGRHTSAGEEIACALRNIFWASTRHGTPHNRTVPSHDPDANVRPLGAKAKLFTHEACPLKVRSSRPVSASHSLMVV